MNGRSFGGLVCFALFVAAAPLSAAEPLRATASATLKIEGSWPIQPAGDDHWQFVPDYLAHADLFFRSQPQSPVLEFTVEKPGLVLLVAAWSYDSDEVNEPWTEKSQSAAQLIHDGWTLIGKMQHTDLGRHYIFRRIAQAGERFQIQTRFKTPPYPMVVRDRDVAEILELKPLVTSERKTFLTLDQSAGQRQYLTAAAASPKTVCLHSPEPDQPFLRGRLGVLLREIVKQGLAIASEDELGIPTCDASLRENTHQTDEPANLPFEVTAVTQPGNNILAGIFRKNGENWNALWDEELRLPSDHLYEDLTFAVEGWSRKEFVDVLRKAGFQGSEPLPQRDSAAVPEEAVKLAEQLTVPAQFGALQLLHAEIRKNGQSPELLGALARSYALLGVLCDQLWSPAHKVFKARALLYAERAVQRWPKLATPLENRAYVRTLVGMHRAALDDLVAAASIRAGKSNGDTNENADGNKPAPWVAALEAHCKFDPSGMELAAKEESQLPLVRLLQMLNAESSGSECDIISASGALLQAAPGCLRAVDGASRVHQLGFHRYAVQYGTDMTAKNLLDQVGQIPALPISAAQAVEELHKARNAGTFARLLGAKPPDELAARIKLIAALREASPPVDAPQPSWQVLATLLEETNFLQSWWQVDVAANWLGWPPDETIEAVAKQVENHPFAPFLSSYQTDQKKAIAALHSLPAVIEPAIMEFKEQAMIQRINFIAPDWIAQHWPNGFYSEESLASDLPHIYRLAKFPKNVARSLRQVSPYMPIGVVAALEYDLEGLRGKLAELEKQYADCPIVLLALAKRHAEEKSWDDAIRCYQTAVKLDPTKDAYQSLATIYLQQGDEEKWLSTLEEFLKTESLGLEHGQIQDLIANHFIEKREWARARTYADAAAETWAAWALLKAGQCAEAEQDWQAAEQWYAAAAQRYQNRSAEWYEFCRRTGQGDLQQSLAGAQQFVRKAEQGGSEDDRFEAAMIHVLQKEPKEAAAGFQKAFYMNHVSNYALYAALQFDEVGDVAARRNVLAKLNELRSKYEPTALNKAYLELGQLLTDALAVGSKPDVHRFDKIINSVPPRLQGELLYISGWYFDRHGQPEQAMTYWNRCMADTDMRSPARTLAGAGLWDRGIQPASYKAAVFEKPN